MSGVSLSVSAEGLDGLINRLRRARGRISGESNAVIGGALRGALTTVQRGTPVRTGDAQRGWATSHPSAWEWRLANPVFYVIFLRLGTRYMDPSATLNAALDLARRDLGQIPARLGARIVTSLQGG